jgi:hypothetical protein
MAVQERAPDQGSDDLRRNIKSVAHDLNNLLYRLSLLSDSSTAPSAVDGTREMLLDTTRRLASAIERLRQLSGNE